MAPPGGAVTEYIAETSYVARRYCPGCEPDADPIREILDVRWCDGHAPDRGGLDDPAVRTDAILSGSAEAEGADNRQWCEMIHRGARRRRRPRLA